MQSYKYITFFSSILNVTGALERSRRFVQTPQVQRQLTEAFLTPEKSTEMGIRQTGYESVNWIELLWDRIPRKDLVIHRAVLIKFTAYFRDKWEDISSAHIICAVSLILSTKSYYFPKQN